MNTYQNLCRIPLSEIIIEDYQRGLNKARVERIAASFDANKAGVLVVSRRDDHLYAVIDGQHRLCAMRKIGLPAANCIVMQNLTYEQEADFFRKQTLDTQSLRALDFYRAGIAAGDEHYLSIQAVLDRNDYVAGDRLQPRVISAIGALSRIMEIFGAEVLDITLKYITAAWRGDPTALRREMLAGLAEFAARYGNRVTPDMFARKFGSWLPSDVFYEYRRRSDGRITPQSAFKPMFRRLFCLILLERYNKGFNGMSRNRLKLED